MTSPLDQFRLEPNVYRLGQFAPVSIRDQVIRANFLMEHLANSGELAQTSRLVILGAGAAGLTAAATAAKLGVQRIVLVEKAGTVMSLQARSASRWLDPVQYDWPATHWADEVWPLEENPRRFTAVTVAFPPLHAALAEDWALEFQNRTLNLLAAGIQCRFHTQASDWRRVPSGAWVEVDLTDLKTNAVQSVDADILIIAVGFGTEQASLPNSNPRRRRFSGLDFWSTDEFELPSLGLPQPNAGVLVSGAGDGALQDFIRLSTGAQSAREVLRAVWSATTQRAAWKESFTALWHWEDNALRSRSFVTGTPAECDVLKRLHQRHAEAVEQLATSRDWPAVLEMLDDVTSGRERGSVQLAFICDHFSWCYPLNRTTALLVARYLESRGHQVLRSFSAVQSTAAVAHLCKVGCWGKPHEVSVAQGVSCAHTAAARAAWPVKETTKFTVNGLVVRHGIDPLTFGRRTFSRLAPQVVPYHLP
ncbi:MAG TPA: NAD(P)-binding protein [Roseateles sp.]|uniref:NAD(P)-binding protein n=1 Tax=Roseateles sp. TaxID=1971397 RepID=UPI002EDB7D5C